MEIRWSPGASGRCYLSYGYYNRIYLMLPPGRRNGEGGNRSVQWHVGMPGGGRKPTTCHSHCCAKLGFECHGLICT